MIKQIPQLEQQLNKDIKVDEPLAPYTTYKIGGNADFFFIAENNEDLVRAVTYARKLKITYYILSGGSNVLVSDQGYKGLIILNKANDIVFKDDNRVVADAGVKLMDLVQKTADKGLSGLENLAGIPGSVGGAIRGNAGAFQSEICDHLLGVEVMRGSKQFVLEKEQCEFKYRDSIFKHKSDLIISGEWQLGQNSKDKIQKTIIDILEKRKDGQPLECPSAGCVFKNVLINSENMEQVDKIKDLPEEYIKYKKIPAAWLIDSLSLKGKKIGDAQVSEKHANFILNLGNATANDIMQLINLIKKQVHDIFGLELEEEIQYLGF